MASPRVVHSYLSRAPRHTNCATTNAIFTAPSPASSTSTRYYTQHHMAQFTPHASSTTSRSRSTRSSSSLVFLRVKRKRQDDPVECLLVPRAPQPKRSHVADQDAVAVQATTRRSMSGDASSSALSSDLMSAFTALSTKDRSLVFTRIDTLEGKHEDVDARWPQRLQSKAKAVRKAAQRAAAQAHATAMARMQQQQQALGRERRQSEIQRLRGLSSSVELQERGTLDIAGVHVVDLETSKPASSSPVDEASSSSDSAQVTANGAVLRQVRRVLNPFERQVDEAIWTAFVHNDFAPFFQVTSIGAPNMAQDPRVFQRPADGGTILMAAAMHGRTDVIEAVLRTSAASVLQDDWNGMKASDFAREHGFPEVETALKACEDVEKEREYVYDVYCVDLAASREHETSAQEDDRVALAPVVALSSAVQRWLAQDTNEQGNDAVDSAEDLMLSDDAGSSDNDGESMDSNDENCVYNDYPDESSDESDGNGDANSDSDDNMDSGGWRYNRRGYHDEDDEGVDRDEEWSD